MFKRIIDIPRDRHLFLFGPRQTGKSTLIRTLFTDTQTLFLDLLKNDVFQSYVARPELFRQEVIEAGKRGILRVVVDEVQRVPALLNEVHGLIESLSSVQFILTASSARKLKRENANLLAGRALTRTLFPLVSREIDIDWPLATFFQFGSLPPIVMEKNIEYRRDILRSYVDTYLSMEIQQEARLRNLGAFLRFLSLAAVSSGQIINYAKIGGEAAVSGQMVKGYFELLEDTLIGWHLSPWGRSLRKRIVRHPRFYFVDPGILRAILKRTAVPVGENDPEFGQLFEHLIINEVRALDSYLRRDLSLSFFRTEKGAEVDLIIETPAGKTIAMEIKSARNPEARHMGGLRSFQALVPHAQCIIACRAERPYELDHGIKVLPWREAVDYVIDG